MKKFKVKSSKLKVQNFLFIFLLFAVHCSLFTSNAFAADNLELTLIEAINISLKENLSLSEVRLNSKIAEGDVTFREGEFDPNVELKATESYKKYPSASLLTGTEDKIASGDLGIGGKINTGAAYELKWSNERIKSNMSFLTINPYYTSDLTLTLTQPILKGFGKEMQESSLNVARNNLEISKLNIDDRASSTIADTANAYWDLSFTIYDREVAEMSLKLAQNLLAEIKAKIDAGLLAPVEIYKAEAEVSIREEALLRVKKIIHDAADRLRVIMNLKDWHKELIPVDKTPSPSAIQPVEDAIIAAFNDRKDYQQALIDYQNKEILKKYYDNQRYPDLNLIGSAGLNGLNSTYGEALDKLGSRDYYSWLIGLSIRIPIGNRAAEGNYIKAVNEAEKSGIALKALEQKITAEVREAWRSLQLASETITATRKTKTAAEKRLEAEEGRFKVGMATVNDVFRFQEEYARALSSEKKAEMDYAKSLIGFEKAKGALIETMP